MKLSAPTKAVWLIATILGLLGIIGYFVHTIPVVSQYPFWLVVAGFAVLDLAVIFKGL